MSESKGASRAVDRMLDVIRAEEPPPLDWDAVERSLALRIRRGEGYRAPAKPISGIFTALTFAAAAAVLPFALSMGGHSAETIKPEVHTVNASLVAPAPGQAGRAGAHDLSALHSGDAVEAKTAAVTFADAGKVSWTLSPESRVVVRSAIPESGIGHVVQLERGSIRVEVQPDLVTQGLVDVLAVEVGQTRVAVHGTAFTVTLADGEVLVDVEHGVVTVGPAGQRGATTGYQLPAGSRAAFSLDGGRHARWLPRDTKKVDAVAAINAPAPDVIADAPTHVAAPPIDMDTPAVTDPPPAQVKAPQPSAAPSAQAAKEPSDPTPPAPTVEVQKPTMSAASVAAGLSRCFQQAHPSAGVDGPKLTASSTLTLKIRADGSVEAAQFNPPLPSIQGCAAFVYSGRFATAASGYSLSIPVSLSQ
ncbi:MAG: FecR domain-containing protein [Polyangiaceae bacterium]|nr:FecR domain-containing protein [Polyangiaceae bacterium]